MLKNFAKILTQLEIRCPVKHLVISQKHFSFYVKTRATYQTAENTRDTDRFVLPKVEELGLNKHVNTEEVWSTKKAVEVRVK